MSIRIAVIGRNGQVARALAEAGPAFGVEVVSLGRPELDLAVPETVEPILRAALANIVVNAAAYTAVDQAEREPEQANAINALGAGTIATAARTLGIPVIHLSTDYVFDGNKAAPYVEEDQAAPTSIYGASKLAGERAVAAAHSNYVILRTAWVYAAGTAETNWADFAAAIFAILAQKGLRTPVLIPIASAEYPTAARRPANSRLDCSKLARLYGVKLPSWREALPICLDALTKEVDRVLRS